MSSEVNVLFVTLEQLRMTLEETWDKTGIAASQSADLGGEFEQEISTDLDRIQGAIRQVTDDLDSVIEESKTLWEDYDEVEDSMREDKE